MNQKEWTPELEKLILEAREAVKTDDVAMFASDDDLLLYEHFYLNGFEAAASQLKSTDSVGERNQQKWILMNDEKPQDYQKVLVFDSRDNNQYTCFFVPSQSEPERYITHWQPLPEPPVSPPVSPYF